MNSSGKTRPIAEERKPIIRWPSSASHRRGMPKRPTYSADATVVSGRMATRRRPGAAEGAFGFLDIVEDRQSAPVIRLAIERRAHLSRRPLQQPHPEPRFKLLDGIAGRRGGQAEVFGCADEATARHDPREHPHGVNPIHCSFFSDSDPRECQIMWQTGRVIYRVSKAVEHPIGDA